MSEIRPRFRTIEGLSVRCTETGEVHDHDALLLSPWPESLYSYDATWSRVEQQARLVAADLPGFGQSELRQDLLSPMAMDDFLIRIADAFDMP